MECVFVIVTIISAIYIQSWIADMNLRKKKCVHLNFLLSFKKVVRQNSDLFKKLLLI